MTNLPVINTEGVLMRRLVTVVTMTLLLMTMLTGTSVARGVSTDTLQRAGWTCIPASTGPHCFPPGAFSSDASVTVLVFDDWGPEGELLGSELLIRADLYAGQPCPQSEVEFLPAAETGLGVDYFACHHYDTGG